MTDDAPSHGLDEAHLDAAVEAHTEILDAAYDAIDRHFGSLSDGAGISSAVLTALSSAAVNLMAIVVSALPEGRRLPSLMSFVSAVLMSATASDDDEALH